MEKTRIARLHEALMARDRCTAANNPYAEKWTETINELLLGAPCGSGFDNGTQLLAWTAGRVQFATAFHHMAESGMYDGCTEHTVTAHPEFSGFSVDVSGRNRNDIKRYIAETFEYWLGERVGE